MTPPTWYRSLGKKGCTAFWSSYSGFSIDAMNVQIYAFVLPALLALWELTPSAAGLLASAALISGSAGGWLAGSLSDRIGRIRVLRVSILWLAVSTTFCGFARSYDELLIARLIQGFGFGAEWAVGVVFMSEIAQAATRGRVLGTLQSAWAAGWALAAAITSVSLALLPPDTGWRIAFFVGLLPALVLFRVRSGMDDTPVFDAAGSRQAWHRIFSREVRGNTVKGSLLATGTHGGYWAIATWWPTMLRLERGMSALETTVHMATLIGGSFLGYVLGAWLSDHAGRRATLGGFAFAGIVVVLAATQLRLSDAVLLALSPVLGLFALGIYSAVGPVLTELYPTSLRGSGMGFCYNIGRGLAGVTPLAVGGSIAALGYAQAIGLYVAASYGAVLFATALLQETRGIDLVASQSA
ncbi:MFS transporter [Sphingomonas oleivorans]|uniref:MFS transporter n=1 Tax=Sphingomonas oleivorans TaxID=1735121 RepID=A0A2T5FWU2_9SPHN|nr:MFS transporter [Sphingomonas oleivorans]PTQ10261.1 MFS transporter [Sphingomonas oleivorans]